MDVQILKTATKATQTQSPLPLVEQCGQAAFPLSCSPEAKGTLMAKIPSRKFPKTKKKIASRPFPKSKSKIPSRKFAKGTAKIASRKFSKALAKEKHAVPVCLDRPTSERARQDRLATLMGQVESLRSASDL